MTRSMAIATVVGLLSLVALWAFVSYLQPGFTGELADAILRCN